LSTLKRKPKNGNEENNYEKRVPLLSGNGTEPLFASWRRGSGMARAASYEGATPAKPEVFAGCSGERSEPDPSPAAATGEYFLPPKKGGWDRVGRDAHP